MVRVVDTQVQLHRPHTSLNNRVPTTIRQIRPLHTDNNNSSSSSSTAQITARIMGSTATIQTPVIQ